MDIPQLPKWYSVERRNEVLQKFKAYVLTREGAVVTAIVAVAIIALATGTFYVVRKNDRNDRGELERLRLEHEKSLGERSITLPPAESDQRRVEQQDRFKQQSTLLPEDQAALREAEQLKRFGQ